MSPESAGQVCNEDSEDENASSRFADFFIRRSALGTTRPISQRVEESGHRKSDSHRGRCKVVGYVVYRLSWPRREWRGAWTKPGTPLPVASAHRRNHAQDDSRGSAGHGHAAIEI